MNLAMKGGKHMATETFLEKGFTVTPDKVDRFIEIMTSDVKRKPRTRKATVRYLKGKEIRDFLKL